jgi:hypothetical protein
MQDESNQEHFTGEYIERLVVLQMLGRSRGCTRARLLADLDDVEPRLIDRAMASLVQVGLLCVKRTRFYPSPAMQRLDELAMICV